MSSFVRDFVKRSCHGAIVSTRYGKPFKFNEPVVAIDMNSQYPYALSLIDLPLGLPRSITSKMTWSDVLSKPCFVVETTITKYHTQHELDIPLTGKQVLNQIDFQYRKFEFDQSIPPRGYYWENLTHQPLKEFVNVLYAYKLKPETKSVAKAMLNKLIGMFIRNSKKTYHVKDDSDYRTNPLVKGYYTDANGDRQCEWYKDVDYRYTFPIIQSLVYSKAKQLMNDVFVNLHANNVPLLYTSTDSLTIPSKFEHLIQPLLHETELGKFKVEARGERAIFIDRGLYYISDDKYAASTCNKEALEHYASKNKLTIYQLFEKLMNCELISFNDNGRKYTIGKSAISKLLSSRSATRYL